MSLPAAQALYELARSGVLTSEQFATVIRSCFWGTFPSVSTLQEFLRSQGWLTEYQFNVVIRGQAAQLRLGRYRILDKLGEGGFGQVYHARETDGMQREVTLKILRKQLTDDPQALQRFLREMMVVGQLNHRHLVSGLDANRDGQNWYLVLEYIRGIDLRELVHKRGPLPWREACEYIRQTANGLQYILKCGLIHRDIKPANLLREDPTGTIKILDLGLAKAEEVYAHLPHGERMTHPQLVIGTPEYMAPEQFEDASRLDIRADLYSLGAVLYFLLTGEPPFRGEHAIDVLQGVLDAGPPDVRRVRSNVPAPVAKLIMHLMARDPNLRPREPLQVSRYLQHILTVPTVAPVNPAGSPPDTERQL
ncbi:serine/threonine-protein kinase [Tuwongella immobilis]|uniref:Protein kinase domain-containing protein n=1 Tax=Tuwongella immobilis TaxID=692036 RepID=A0A6C2YSH7_9BACT|nr:serine/threonine-protein kinase [Tuwongella immobilis]VIP03832.1 serine threonine protein kinase : Serine/threonine protein kinase OS=Rhodopirellula sp. SWK7 GN=RRSWK_05524 PE=3 SV=1: Pkinase [Tuwongella immobilis]VTS05031.1 serine threonine protein kinase : Serine/threonine protein kinase OS=Rhodopirellula sp. SWK7 GN=RRSWK_05524 PE=3 SV=1: Pkinase [Tuwongella immobilis]